MMLIQILGVEAEGSCNNGYSDSDEDEQEESENGCVDGGCNVCDAKKTLDFLTVFIER